MLDGGQILRRKSYDLSTWPEYKRNAVDVKGDGGPVYRPVSYVGEGPIEAVAIGMSAVTITRSAATLVEPEPLPIPTLAELKDQLSANVDMQAEQVRQKYITAGDGMVMTYREKFEQAELVNEIGEVAANALSSEERIAAYPTLAASVGLEAPTLWECAQLVRLNYAQFAQLSHVIEKTRLSGKASVSSASTAEEAQAAYEAIQWTV